MPSKESSRRMTMPEAIRLQKEDLDRWYTILQPHVFRDLEQWCWGRNNSTEDPYEIPRGQTIDEYIKNELMKKYERR